jgi:pimeloyl-ACP methyl ester carboxylesterase
VNSVVSHDESGPEGAPLVVLIHGSMDRSSSFAKVVRRLGDLRVLRYDRRGYARSLQVGGPYDLASHADDLIGLLAGRPATLVGHSLGGDIALVAATRRPDLVLAVAAFESPMSWEPWWPVLTAGSVAVASATTGGASPADAAEVFLRRMIGDRLWERLPAATRHERRAEGSCLVGELADLRRGVPYDLDVLRALGIPVVVGYGTESAVHHRRAAVELAERAGGEVVVIPGAGHGAHASHPDEFAALVRRAVALGEQRRTAQLSRPGGGRVTGPGERSER